MPSTDFCRLAFWTSKCSHLFHFNFVASLAADQSDFESEQRAEAEKVVLDLEGLRVAGGQGQLAAQPLARLQLGKCFGCVPFQHEPIPLVDLSIREKHSFDLKALILIISTLPSRLITWCSSFAFSRSLRLWSMNVRDFFGSSIAPFVCFRCPPTACRLSSNVATRRKILTQSPPPFWIHW